MLVYQRVPDLKQVKQVLKHGKINVCKARASHFVCHFAMVPVHACPWWVQLGEILLILWIQFDVI
jgi:hypothetical protein